MELPKLWKRPIRLCDPPPNWTRETNFQTSAMTLLPRRAFCRTAPCYAGSTTTFVLTGVLLYRWIMSCVSRPMQPLVMPFPIDSASRDA